MINVYVLYNDTPKSLAYLESCKASLEKLDKGNKFSFIPVLGYIHPDAVSLYEEQKIPIIDYYQKQLSSNISDDHRRELNGALNATMGHAKIWELIAKSEQPGIVLEHDAIFKSIDFDLSHLENFMIFWLGLRVSKETDYVFPTTQQVKHQEVLRFEGVHAYAITPKTAEHLCKKWKEYGFIDSIDGFLAMRNYYRMTMVVLDPPPVVAVVNRDGDGSSTIEASVATWNAKNFPGFLSGLTVPAPPERIVEYENREFIESFPWVVSHPPKILAITNDDGTAVKVLANNLLCHGIYDCRLDYVCPKEKAQVIAYKAYFSNYYYKIRPVTYTEKEYSTIQHILNALDMSEYNFGYVDCRHLDKTDALYNSIRMLEHINWILVYFDKVESGFIDTLESMGYLCEALGHIVSVRKR